MNAKQTIVSKAMSMFRGIITQVATHTHTHLINGWAHDRQQSNTQDIGLTQEST